MRLYRAGDRSAGICEGCQTRVTTRMVYQDYTPIGWEVSVPDVLVAVCEVCGQVVGVPHQSTPRINEYRKDKTESDVTISIEARVPREIDEALDLAMVTLGGPARTIRSAVMRYYLAQMSRKPVVAEAVKRQSAGKPLGPADRRIVVKLATGRWLRVLKASKAAGIRSKSELIRGIAMLAAEDCRIVPAGSEPVINKESRHRLAFLKQLAESL